MMRDLLEWPMVLVPLGAVLFVGFMIGVTSGREPPKPAQVELVNKQPVQCVCSYPMYEQGVWP